MNNDNQLDFKSWLGLDLYAVSWEGRNLKEFDTFWGKLFLKSKEEEIFSKLESIKKILFAGPLYVWIEWLEKQYLIFIFLYKQYSLNQLVRLSKKNNNEIQLMLWEFFYYQNIELEDYWSKIFFVKGESALSYDIDIVKLKSILAREILTNCDGENFQNLEVTLLPEWRKIEKEFLQPKKNKGIKKKSRWGARFYFLQEVIILFIIGGLFIFTVKVGNTWYKDVLVKKISLFSPDFFWLDKSVSYLTEDSLRDSLKDVRHSDLDIIESEKLDDKMNIKDEYRRFEVESDVVLTSVDSLPKNFSVADFERSSYEEKKKGGYRNYGYGRRAYRVMLSSVEPQVLKMKLEKLLEKYGIQRADEVEPGKAVPGGLYYNLYVPRPYLKEFLSIVSTEKDSIILESKTVLSGPKDSDKVFIWIKSI